tara:strand:- start:400 stop:654 length:255 start_codon:yes stop_codon:yes gene_type:complete
LPRPIKYNQGAVFALRLPFCEDATIAAVNDDDGKMYVLRLNVETKDVDDVECYYDHDLDCLEAAEELIACIEHCRSRREFFKIE